MHTFITILCSLAILMSPVTAGSIQAKSDSQHKQEVIASRTLDVLQMRMDDLKKEANDPLVTNENISSEISTISTIYSFSGSEYILVEYEPVGYIIYDPNSGTFLESSAVATSPYANADGEKYYAGPNEYYVLTEESGNISYTHTIYNEVIDNDDISAYVQACEELDSMLEENPNTTVLSYVKEGVDMFSSASPMSTEVGNITYVKNYTFFKNLNYCGHTEIDGSGICGYIAAGILLTYDVATNHYPTVSSMYYSKSSAGVYSISSSLPRDLYDLGVSLGYGTSTTSVAIHYTVKQYLEDSAFEASHTSLYTPFATNIGIREKIDDDRPVIWFGSVSNNSYNSKKNINHAVVVYGYEYGFWSGTTFTAHFGWTGATSVTFSGTLGSMYTYSITSYGILD